MAEVTIRQYLRERKRELGWTAHARLTYVPQAYEAGQESQLDWYEAWVELSGEPVLLQVFSMRSRASGAAFPPGPSSRDSAGIPGSAPTSIPDALAFLPHFHVGPGPGALPRRAGAQAGRADRSKPLAAWRHRRPWPQSYDRFWEELILRHRKQSG